MNLKKILLIARREYLFNLRRRSFLFSMFGLPIFFGVVIYVSGSITANAATDISAFTSVGIVDQTNVLDGFTPPDPFRVFATTDEAAAALQSGAINGYYVFTPTYQSTGRPDAFYRPDPVFTEALNNALLNRVIKPALARQLGSEQVAERLEAPLAELAVYRQGSDVELGQNALIAAIFVPIALGMIVFILTMTTSQFLMQGMVEEKENRMLELFATSSRPSEILWGKLIGLGGLSLTQFAVWGLFALVLGTVQQSINVGQILATANLTPGYFGTLILFSMLGFLFYGAIMAGIGATVNAEQESRQVASIISMVGILPVFLIFMYFFDPNGVGPTLMSLIPFTAPIGMIMRASLVNVPTAEILLSAALLVVGIVITIWVSARLFRLGMLNYGKRLRLRDVLRIGRNTSSATLRGGAAS